VTTEATDPTGRALAARPVLPAQLSSFVGREREVMELRTLIQNARLVTLTGTGGSGKTRLALEAARGVSEQLDGEAHFVDLAPLTDPGMIASSISSALSIRGEPRRPLLDTVIDSLAARRLLLILDNLEQLPGAAQVIAGLLGRCPNVRVLATSRAPLHLRGEHDYPVDPLDLPGASDQSPEALARNEAVSLFVERARAVEPRFALTAENAGTIAEICRRLDGLPLAIELAAARSRILGPGALLRRLEHRLDVPSGGATDAPARQRTLRDTIAWSYELLDPQDRRLFTRISVFVGGFTMSSVEEVLSDPTDPPAIDLLDALGRLVDHNLLYVAPDAEDEPRFRLLETVREYAAEQLTATDSEGLRRRHAAYFMRLAEQAMQKRSGPTSARWDRRLTNEVDNLRGALAWARDQGEVEILARMAIAAQRVMVNRVDHEEAGRWLHAAEAVAEKAGPRLRADLYWEVASFEMEYAGDRTRVEALMTRSLHIYETLRDESGMAWTLYRLAQVAADLGHTASATRRMRQALGLAQMIPDERERALLLAYISNETKISTSLDVTAVATEAIRLGRQVADPLPVSVGLVTLGIAAIETQDAKAAVRELSEAARILHEQGFRSDLLALPLLATARLRAGEIDPARSILMDALLNADEIGARWIVINTLEASADWLGAVGHAENAAVCWAAVDEARAASLDRTLGTETTIFRASRERDHSALSRAAFAAASTAGRAMSLKDAVAYAIQALDDAEIGDGGPAHPERRGRYDLTPREHEVLELLAAGRSDGEIAEALFISKKTAAVHVANIKGKLGAGSRVEIVTLALRRGLVDTAP
jgi:predicted ATPase/DNA-binding CsgD family transcriptional regulator